MKHPEFKTYTGTAEDADGDKHTSEITAHVVTKETAGRVLTVGGGRDVKPGDVLVQTDRPDVYDVVSKDGWASAGYKTKPTTQQNTQQRAPQQQPPKTGKP